ncbi:MAG: AzlC family ABC transporter permease [Pelagimonas sp.]|jgi:4-azaleucine resistance transporter AzlC|nr:AzlC family ABC transporter permease [Pelagimonas sp.]
MAQSAVMSRYWHGLRDGAPFILVVTPFATLFGVIATEAGLNVLEALAFSVLVIAGTAQFTAVQLMTENAHTIVVLGSALAVNLRMAMYSASLTPHLRDLPLWKRAIASYFLVDQSYAMSAIEFERAPERSVNEKFAYFLGVCTPFVPFWYLGTLVGALIGTALPLEQGFDFVLPIAFLSMIAPALRTRAHIIAALTATGLALGLVWLPYNLGLICAGIGGMAAGAEVERRASA